LIDGDGKLEVGHLSRCTTRRVLAGRRTPYEVELLDEKGNVIAVSALYADEPVGCPCFRAPSGADPAHRCRCTSGRDAAMPVPSGGASGEKAAGPVDAAPLVTGLALVPDREAARGARPLRAHPRRRRW